jgi:hypothetical protein
MRRSHVATALVVITAGMTAAAGLRRLVGRRRPATTVPVPAPATPVPAAVAEPVPASDAVVLRFARRDTVAPAPEQPVRPARCGDSGGRTKAGGPCGARANSGGRCHHHPIAA